VHGRVIHWGQSIGLATVKYEGGFKHEVQHGITIDETPLLVF
jgi:hypothetical protein